mgnify:CR=1 FL=1
MKTIIMQDPVPEALGSRFPQVNVTAQEAEQICADLGGRLPTSEEYDRFFAQSPWPHLVWEWTSTLKGPGRRVVRGGAWNFPSKNARASDRDVFDPSFRIDGVGFRCARNVPDDAVVPEGWEVLK